MSNRPIGYQMFQTWCRECVPEGVRDYYGPVTENYGPLWCDICDKELKPCEHDWSDWHAFVWGGEFRLCEYCEATEHRDESGNPIPRPPMPPLPARPA